MVRDNLNQTGENVDRIVEIEVSGIPLDAILSKGSLRGEIKDVVATKLPKKEYRKDVYSTGEIARICNVHPKKVGGWFNSGRLKGYRDSSHCYDARIPHKYLIEFMKQEGYPLGELESTESE